MVNCEYIGTITIIANFDENKEFINLDDDEYIECQLCGGNALKCLCEMYYD